MNGHTLFQGRDKSKMVKKNIDNFNLFSRTTGLISYELRLAVTINVSLDNGEILGVMWDPGF